MDRPGDDDYEVLDLGEAGPAGDTPETRASELPPLDLDTAGRGVENRSEPDVAWRRWAMVAAAFAVGAILGAYVWDARHEAAELAAAEGEVSLVAWSFTLSGSATDGDVVQATVGLRNIGPRDVEALEVKPAGWTTVSTDQAATTLVSGQWATISILVVPDCSAPSPEELEVVARTEVSEETVRVGLPPDRDQLEWAVRSVCDLGGGAYGLSVGDLTIRDSRPGELAIELGVRPVEPGQEFEITSAHASTAGFRGIATALPDDGFAPGRPALSPVVVTWRVEQCRFTPTLGRVVVLFEVSGADGEQVEVPAELPPKGVAALARFSVRECGE